MGSFDVKISKKTPNTKGNEKWKIMDKIYELES